MAADTPGPARGLVSATVVCATREAAHVVPVVLPAGATLRDAVLASGLLERCAEPARGDPQIGVFNHVRSPDTLLRDGDRVEIYRPLVIDPKESRRRRARLRRSSKGG